MRRQYGMVYTVVASLFPHHYEEKFQRVVEEFETHYRIKIVLYIHSFIG